jgi:dTDP-4-amino-4,6-dideoxygalactose transaminase
MTELQAALGLSQLDRINEIRGRRFWNFCGLYVDLRQYWADDDILYFPWTELSPDYSNTSPFGFPVSVKSDKITKQELVHKTRISVLS